MVFTTTQRALVYGFLSRRILAFEFSDYGADQDLRLYGHETTNALAASNRTWLTLRLRSPPMSKVSATWGP